MQWTCDSREERSGTGLFNNEVPQTEIDFPKLLHEALGQQRSREAGTLALGFEWEVDGVQTDGPGQVDEVGNSRPLRRLGSVSAAVLLAAVAELVVHDWQHDPGDKAWAWLPVVWAVAVLAFLVLLGAVSGLWSRRALRRRDQPKRQPQGSPPH
ncbi:hypothetical protein GCM10022197_22080 [Microlunatus spumicola]|uniref:Uncharacterized protein n=1 Tax=Microlunatus spumicola TaxID=81499 RepID=A0ABP6XJS4_9ACTN